MKPEEAMRKALLRARRVVGRTFPNPAVGAVIFKGKTILGSGATRPPGGSHAEVVALERARRRFGSARLRGATMAVTLEPCSFTGRTGPCTEAILEAGIARVIVGCRDPHPRVSGRGLRQLEVAGVEVTQGVLETACREHHRGFFSVCDRGRPYVTLKLASTLDGRIATAGGESRWITGPAARETVHSMRSRHDAVMVGSKTALVDDPELSARKGDRVVHRPVRILVDSRLRVGARAKLYKGLLARGEEPAASRTWVLTSRGARRKKAIAATGARILEVARRGAHLDLARAFEVLGEQGLTSVLVEGGGQLAAALLRAGLVDEIHWFQAPMLLGGDARPALGALEIGRLRDRIELEDLKVSRVGGDLHFQARPAQTGSRPVRRRRGASR